MTHFELSYVSNKIETISVWQSNVLYVWTARSINFNWWPTGHTPQNIAVAVQLVAVQLYVSWSLYIVYNIVIRSNNSAGISRTKVLLSHGENLLKDIIIFWSIAVNQAIIQNTNMHVIILPCCWVFDVLTMFLIIFERKSYPKT